MKDLNHSDSANKSGGSWGTRPDGTYGQTSKFFSWMHEHYDQQLHSAKEILETLGFQTETTEDGSLSITGYDDKAGDEEQFLAVLAPFVPDGSYLNWTGEDGYHWQHWFEGGVMEEKSGSVIYA